MNVDFYNFTKRRNSTKIPTATGTTIACTLKEPCSLKSPVLTISGDVFGYDYAYIADFARYYFVSEVTSVCKGVTQYTLEEDILASNKAAIGSTVARVAFSSTGWDKDIIDSRILTKTTKIKYANSATLSSITSAGSYVLTVFSKDATTSSGFATIYVMDATNLSKLKQWMSDDSIYSAISTFIEGSALSSIYSCIWVPFNLSVNPGSAVSRVYIGNKNTIDDNPIGITAYVLGATTYATDTASITIPYRYNDFRDSEPFSSSQLYLPGIGYSDFNMADWLDSTSIALTYVMDYATGDLTYRLEDSTGKLIQTMTCNVSSPCALGQTLTNGAGIVSAVGGGAAAIGGFALSAISGNAAGAVASAGALLTAAGSLALSVNKRANSIKGSIGGRTSTEINQAILTGFYMDTEDVDDASYIAQKGRPVGVTHAISNHSGYVQCDEASISMAGDSYERDAINSFLNGGFFYE